jgi:hypothetical protein
MVMNIRALLQEIVLRVKYELQNVGYLSIRQNKSHQLIKYCFKVCNFSQDYHRLHYRPGQRVQSSPYSVEDKLYEHLAPLVAVFGTTSLIVFHVGRLESSSIYRITTYSNRQI